MRLSIENDFGSTELPISFGGTKPDYRVGPVHATTGGCVLGTNTVALSAEDWGGHISRQQVTITRVPVEGRIMLPDDVVTMRRGSTGEPNPVAIRLVETFMGSLAGRDEIRIQVTGGGLLRGSALLRDPLNDPDPVVRRQLRSSPGAPLGVSCLVSRVSCLCVTAREVETGRLLDTADLAVSVIPAHALTRGRDTIALYATAPLAEFSGANNTVDALLQQNDQIEKLSPLRVTYTNGTLAISQRYRAHWNVLTFVEADTNFSSEVAVRVDGPRLRLSWQPYRVAAAPNISVSSLPAAAVWTIAQNRFEAKFTEKFKDPFLTGLFAEFDRRLTDVNPQAGSFLRDVRVSPGEFAIGFCVPNQVFPRPDCRRDQRPGPAPSQESSSAVAMLTVFTELVTLAVRAAVELGTDSAEVLLMLTPSPSG